VGMLAKIRRMHFRDKVSVREIARQTGLSRNTVREWLGRSEMIEPQYPKRASPSVLDPYKEQLVSWLKTDSHRPKRDRRTSRFMFLALQTQGYPGSYDRVIAFVRQWRQLQEHAPKRQAYVPMRFAPGEAFQFDWSCEYAVIGGLRKRLEVAHIKLAFSRAFWLVAYLQQSHEMLFDAHARGLAAFGGIARRGIYDNMKTSIDKVGVGKTRTVNARFQAMCGHYLFEADFCNRAAGWEKGIVEKNVQDRRRQLGRCCSSGAGAVWRRLMPGSPTSAVRRGRACRTRTVPNSLWQRRWKMNIPTSCRARARLMATWRARSASPAPH